MTTRGGRHSHPRQNDGSGSSSGHMSLWLRIVDAGVASVYMDDLRSIWEIKPTSAARPAFGDTPSSGLRLRWRPPWRLGRSVFEHAELVAFWIPQDHEVLG